MTKNENKKPAESIEALRKDVEKMEREQELSKERAKLIKRKKQLKFQTTPLGKISKGVVGVFEKLTRPKPKKPVQPTKMKAMPMIKPIRPAPTMPTPKPSVPTKSFGEIMADIENVASFGYKSAPTPVQTGRIARVKAKIGKRRIKMKKKSSPVPPRQPASISDILRRLPP